MAGGSRPIFYGAPHRGAFHVSLFNCKRITKKERDLELKTIEIPYNERDHALYIAFGPYKNPRYALSVVIEHGGSGSATAAPMAKKLFKLILDRHEIREEIRNRKSVKI